MSVTIAPIAPTSMSGFRTRSRSDTHPTTMSETMSAPQNQAFKPLTWDVDRLTPLAFTKFTVK